MSRSEITADPIADAPDVAGKVDCNDYIPSEIAANPIDDALDMAAMADDCDYDLMKRLRGLTSKRDTLLELRLMTRKCLASLDYYIVGFDAREGRDEPTGQAESILEFMVSKSKGELRTTRAQLEKTLSTIDAELDAIVHELWEVRLGMSEWQDLSLISRLEAKFADTAGLREAVFQARAARGLPAPQLLGPGTYGNAIGRPVVIEVTNHYRKQYELDLDPSEEVAQ